MVSGQGEQRGGLPEERGSEHSHIHGVTDAAKRSG